MHPGGPYWAQKDLGAWSIPKGEAEQGEDLVEVARRELTEETGFSVDGELRPLGVVHQRSGKVVHAWAVRGDADPDRLKSNTFELEWPPKSGRRREFPEVDRAEWFDLAEARRRINPAQAELLDRLEAALRG